METTSRPLAVESFSDSWLSNTRPSLIKVLDKSNTNSFDFDASISDKSLVNFVHADELFSDGLIKPVFLDPINGGVSCSTGSSSKSTTDSDIFALSSLSDPITSVTDQDVQMGCSCCFFRRRRRLLSEQVLRKMFGYLIRTRRAKVVRGSKKSTKVDDIDRRTLEVKSWSSCSSPGPSTVYDIASSIDEAVLYCKRSLGE